MLSWRGCNRLLTPMQVESGHNVPLYNCLYCGVQLIWDGWRELVMGGYYTAYIAGQFSIVLTVSAGQSVVK